MRDDLVKRARKKAARVARRKGRAVRVVATRSARRALRLRSALDAATVTAQRNRAFLDRLREPHLIGLDEEAMQTHRALSLLRARAAEVTEGGLEARLVQRGLLPWTAGRTRLRAAAEAAALEALSAENFALADWLSSSILKSVQSPRAREVQAVLAVHGRDWQNARVWRRRQLKVPSGKRSPKADTWLAEERRRVSTQHLYRLFLAEHGADAPAAQHDGGGDAAHFWSLATAAADRDERITLEARAVVESLRSGRERQRSRRFEESFLAARIADDVHRLDEYLPLFHAFAPLSRTKTLAATEVASSVRTMSMQTFRNFVAGKSICLIANSPRLIGSGCGELIDSYDLVMRFNSFVIEPKDTGARTDVHVTIHLHDYNWDVDVPVRIVLSGDPVLWVDSLRKRVRPHAQAWLGDESLRWPARDLGLIRPDDPFRLPTAGFNLLRLLMHLDVSTAIDMIGFDFYESGKLRLEDAMDIPHSPGHNSGGEREWVMAHAHRVTPMVISMKPTPEAVVP